jgi:carboxyl-terminal processing protease
MEFCMKTRNSKTEFFALLTFLVVAAMLLTNGFVKRISAQDNQVDIYQKIEPLGDVIAKIQEEYVGDADLDKIVEGAISGMMRQLDVHSSFIKAKALQGVREDTRGEFEGIGVTIQENEEKQVVIHSALKDSPAMEAGLLANDIIYKVDDFPVADLELDPTTRAGSQRTQAVADKIRGPRGTRVKVTVLRTDPETEEQEEVDIDVRRAKVLVASIDEARIFDGGIGYIRLKEFSDTSAHDIKDQLRDFLDQGMTSFVFDLRWNPGGLLTASREVAELFLPRNSLVTYTKGRPRKNGAPNESDMELFTKSNPVLPPGFPIILLVNQSTASSSEIVTGALQFYKRALIVGEKTFGKGSVQTIIQLRRPASTALRLTTALYYTPADVTINKNGLLPDISVPTSEEHDIILLFQMAETHRHDYLQENAQNHGTTSGHEVNLLTEEDIVRAYTDLRVNGRPLARTAPASQYTAEDTQLLRAVEVLREEAVWDTLVERYHRDVNETQIAGTFNGETVANGRAVHLEPEAAQAD